MKWLMGDLAVLGALLAFLGVVRGMISAKWQRRVFTGISFAVAVGGFLVFLGG